MAAHYTPSKNDSVVFRTGDVVKIDVGAHVDGYPADTAATVEIGTKNYSQLISCADEALKVVIEMISPGTSLAAIGEAVQRVITSAGYRPIENLTGHSMERYNLHAGLSIPSVPVRERATVKEGMILAIEPFSTTGKGRVDSSGRGEIYRIVRDRRAPEEAHALLTKIKQAYGTFPFAGRWCDSLAPNAHALMNKLTRLGIIMNYPVLCEVGGGIVAQAEHSVLVTKEGCRVVT